jgi:O-antigen/teichoic acid export membrane protein
VTRLLIVPAALAGVLFPAVSARAASAAGRATVDELLVRSVRYLLFGLAPVVALLIALAAPLLGAWLGPAYAVRSAPAFAILAGGVLLNGLAFVPSAYLFGHGRPDVPAKFHLLELPLYLLAAWLLIGRLGVTGAALAWTLRVAVDAALLYGATWRIAGVSPWRLLGARAGRGALAVVLLLGSATAVAVLSARAAATGIALTATVTAAFGIAVWLFVLDDAEKLELRRALL